MCIRGRGRDVFEFMRCLDHASHVQHRVSSLLVYVHERTGTHMAVELYAVPAHMPHTYIHIHHVQVSEPITDEDVDCADIHDAEQMYHVGCLQYFVSRHDAIVANHQQQTPFHLIDHTS